MTVEARWPRAWGYSAASIAAPRGLEGTADLEWTTGRDGAFALARTTTDWRGLFMLCDVPGGSRLRLSVSAPGEDEPALRETFFVPPGAPTLVQSVVIPVLEEEMSIAVDEMESVVDTPTPDSGVDAGGNAPMSATPGADQDTTTFRVTLHLRAVDGETPLLGALIELPGHPRPYVTGMSGQVSLLEAYRFTHRKVEEWYAEKNRLATEHARLDDNGDGVGSALPDTGSGEGLLAGQVTLAKPVEATAPAGSGPVLAELEALRKKKLELESSLRELRTRKAALTSDRYQEQLEALLVELARTTRAIREQTER